MIIISVRIIIIIGVLNLVSITPFFFMFCCLLSACEFNAIVFFIFSFYMFRIPFFQTYYAFPDTTNEINCLLILSLFSYHVYELVMGFFSLNL